jgi:hypothetical protein
VDSTGNVEDAGGSRLAPLSTAQASSVEVTSVSLPRLGLIKAKVQAKLEAAAKGSPGHDVQRLERLL